MEYGGVMTMSASANASERRKIMRADPPSLAQRPRHGGQIGMDLRRFREIAFGKGFPALAGEHQDRLGTHGCGGLQIAQAVAHRRHLLERYVEPLGDSVKQPRVG